MKRQCRDCNKQYTEGTQRTGRCASCYNINRTLKSKAANDETITANVMKDNTIITRSNTDAESEMIKKFLEGKE